MPIFTRRAVALVALGILPAVLAALEPKLAWAALAIDLAVLGLGAVDFVRAPRSVRLTRTVEPVLSAGQSTTVTLRLEARGVWLRGELRDEVPTGPGVEGHHQRFSARNEVIVTWKLTPRVRGDLRLGDVAVRLEGPWGLCARQLRVPASASVKVYPDLTVLTQDALTLARAHDDDARRTLPRISEGRDFDSLREYRPGDDRRHLDWKATARRGRPFVRVHRPEQNQTVWLLLDCGRHLAGLVGGRRKLDLAVDAVLRVAKVSLDEGDLVGVLAFGASVKAVVTPRRGSESLRAITELLYRVEPALEESDYGRALDTAFARGSRRALVVLFTELSDLDTSQALVGRTLKLLPRHLPVVASMIDDEVRAAATAVPTTATQAFERQVAVRLEEDYRLTAARLRDAGARIIRASPGNFGAAAVSEYLQIKQRGAL